MTNNLNLIEDKLIGRNNFAFVIVGPTASGKGTMMKMLQDEFKDKVTFSISATTREPRPNEVNGVNYYFITKEEFENKIKNGDFLEYAEVHKGDYYGTPKKEVLELLNSGKDVILEIDVEGAKQIKNKYPETILIFIMAPSMSEVKRRIKMRGQESNEQIIKRFETAYREINEVNKYSKLL